LIKEVEMSQVKKTSTMLWLVGLILSVLGIVGIGYGLVPPEGLDIVYCRLLFFGGIVFVAVGIPLWSKN